MKGINDEFKKLVFREHTDINEAMVIPLCRILYNKVLVETNEKCAKREVLALYNDTLWLACQDYLGLLLIDPLNLIIDTESKFYNWEWVLATLATTNKGRGMFVNDMMKHPEMMSLIKESELISDKEGIDLNDWGFSEDVCPVTYAPIKDWGDLDRYDWEEMTGSYNIELLDKLYSVAQNDDERKKIYEAIRNDATITHSSYLKEEEVYSWLCKIRIDLQERGAELRYSEKTKCEQEVLNLQRGDSILDITFVRRYLKKLIKGGIIPTDKRSGYIWYSVWLFFFKNNLLNDKSLSAFYRLMNEWFPNREYGKADSMRIYNSVYLKKHNWQIWKFEEFKRKASPKVSERGFNRIRDLYKYLESHLLLEQIWIDKPL